MSEMERESRKRKMKEDLSTEKDLQCIVPISTELYLTAPSPPDPHSPPSWQPDADDVIHYKKMHHSLLAIFHSSTGF